MNKIKLKNRKKYSDLLRPKNKNIKPIEEINSTDNLGLNPNLGPVKRCKKKGMKIE